MAVDLRRLDANGLNYYFKEVGLLYDQKYVSKDEVRVTNVTLEGNSLVIYFNDGTRKKLDEYDEEFENLRTYLNDKFSEVENSVNNINLTVTGKCASDEITLSPNNNVNIDISSVDADTINVTSVTDNNRYLALVDGVGNQEVHNIEDFYVNCDNKKLYVTNIECSGDIKGNRVFNAVWNDYAELMPRGEETEPGDIIMLDLKTKDERYIKATDKLGTVVAGVHSDEFGMLIGGEKPVDSKDLLEYNIDKYIPIALSGRVHVKFIGKAKKGAKVVPSSEPGYGRLYNKGVDDPDTIIGYLVEDDDKTDKRKLKIRITR